MILLSGDPVQITVDKAVYGVLEENGTKTGKKTGRGRKRDGSDIGKIGGV